MARFEQDPNRLNYTTDMSGKEYNLRLVQRAQAIFASLLKILPSNYVSTVQGPNYTTALKITAVEVAKLELALEDVDWDGSFETTRAEFLYSIIGYMALVNGQVTNSTFDDVEFRKFVTALIRIYFQGSVPRAMSDVVKLLISNDVEVKENFLLLRQGATGLDISDQFGFQIDVPCPNQLPPNLFQIEATLRQLLHILKPAHTLYKIRYIFKDTYVPNTPLGTILDSLRWKLNSYYYDDFRSYWNGIVNKDRLGKKRNLAILDEDHSNDF